jgi:hypothetical protein
VTWLIEMIRQYRWLILIMLILLWLLLKPSKKRAEDAGEPPP